MSVSYMVIKKVEDAHYRIQQNIYFSGMDKIEGALLLYSDKIEDFFWNYAAEIDIDKERMKELVKTIIGFYKSKNRAPAIYITPLTKPNNLAEYLKKLGFELKFTDAWMLYESTPKKKVQTSSNFSIREVKNKNDMELFVRIFNESYGGAPSEGEPYAGLSAYYGEALKEAFLKPHPNKKIINYLAYIDNKALGIGSFISLHGYGGIYNLGTIPEYRKKNVGTAISMKAIEDSIKYNIKVLFLQTEKGSYVEKFYSQLGFVTKFIGEGYVLSNEK